MRTALFSWTLDASGWSIGSWLVDGSEWDGGSGWVDDRSVVLGMKG